MNHEDVYETIGRDLFPVFLGSTHSAHRLAMSLFQRWGTVSLIADRKRSLWDLLDPAARFLPLPPSGEPRLTAELLCDLTSSRQDALPLLIPCKEEYTLLIQREAPLLESRFIVVEESALLCHSPIADFPL